MSGLLSVVNASDEDFNNLTAAIDNSDGSAKDMADIMNDNLNGSLTLLGSALEGAGIAFMKSLVLLLKKLLIMLLSGLVI
ncbi:phage tail tape measure protein [Clostridium septicum]|nr:phage tail tape measure protein [Clostridium septicum]QAS60704.1 phage tail tape measure protein [Clostridium septicum]